MDKRLDIVITMGGLGSRFRKVGYTVPKYMIEARGKTLFDWSMESLEGYRNEVDRYIFIAMKDETVDVETFILERCEKLKLPEYHVILLDYLTDGQATTAMLAKEFWDEDNGLLIYNIDTYVESGEMNSGQLKGDGFIPCFKGKGDHWSFVRLDENGKAVEIKEKERISEHCTLGAYYFRTCGLYQSLYEEFYGDKNSQSGEKKNSLNRAISKLNGEKYVAPLYDYLLHKGGEIYICDIDSMKVHVLGTPEELEEFCGIERK